MQCLVTYTHQPLCKVSLWLFLYYGWKSGPQRDAVSCWWSHSQWGAAQAESYTSLCVLFSSLADVSPTSDFVSLLMLMFWLPGRFTKGSSFWLSSDMASTPRPGFSSQCMLDHNLQSVGGLRVPKSLCQVSGETEQKPGSCFPTSLNGPRRRICPPDTGLLTSLCQPGLPNISPQNGEMVPVFPCYGLPGDVDEIMCMRTSELPWGRIGESELLLFLFIA